MRRVDEAMREVLSDALSEDLKDPRVGFVTVTDVKTSPDLRHARVFVSVLGDADGARRDASTASRSAHGVLQATHRQRAAHEAHARRWTSRYDDTAERADALERIIDRLGGAR